jgi:nitrite reductase/ring-hydroxylating ferredoxin subunit
MADSSNRKTDGAGTVRRGFLPATVAGTALALLLATGCGGAKIPPGLFAAGRIGEFPMSPVPRQVLNTSIFVLHDEQGYAAISGECTHDECAVDAVRGSGFVCPCCGSRFAADGTVTGGPATHDLKWFEVLLVESELQIDPAVEVPKGRYMPASNQ